MIALTVNGRPREVASAPLRRLLDVLREELGLTGTKEGCGEGECGSCTVLLDGVPVNACLVAVGQCEDSSVVTVEGLADPEALSPLGQCLVEGGGAQCGICTPGMMVSVHHLLDANPSPTDAEVREAIAGNLCRCTGYQRIVNSVLDAAALYRSRPLPGGEAVTGGGYARARSLGEALELMADAHRRGVPAVALAGGTDWLVERHLAPNPWADGRTPVESLAVDISALAGLAEVEAFEGEDGRPWLRLGAGVTYRTLRTHPVLVERVPVLGAMAADVGAVQIQARGTLGGNLATASPAADGVPVLVALGAVLTLARAGGEREVPIETFYTGYKKTVRSADELITAVAFPIPAPGARWHWRKVGTRRAQSIAKVALAAVVEIDDGLIAVARLAMASVAPTVALLPRVRAELMVRAPAQVDRAGIVAALRADIAPIDDVRSTRAYRLHVAERLVLRLVESLGAAQ